MEFLKKHKRLFLSLGMAVCLTAIIFTASPGATPTFVENALGYVIVPLQRGVSDVTGWIGGKFSTFAEMDGLREENRLLREQNSLLKIDNERLLYAEAENKRLTELLEIDQTYAALPKVGARVIGKDPTDWYNSYNIDKGSSEGLTPNMAVLGEAGLIGLVREVYPTYSKVVSIIDDRCAVAVMCERTGDWGQLFGDIDLMPQGLCRMDYIESDAQIMAGDEIVTSALSSYCPPGILVGTVLSVEPDGNGLTKHAIIEPASRIDRVEVVQVVNQLFGDEEEIETTGE
ncbi:MAG: rod shape-determining protein MreC [Clostridiales bacterium]|jgi:rod shape-determining protein MreC|nr:rod shape-determining protein MreC [Clostridiales bacterium]